jgi:hypothetical protein
MHRPRSCAALGCAALFVLLLPGLARAQASDASWSRLNLDVCNSACELAATVALSLPVAVFAVADIAYASQGQWLPRGLAYAQLSFGVTAGVIGALGLTSSSGDPRFVMLIAAGTLLSAGGLLSVVLNQRSEANPKQPARVQAALVPMSHGFWTGLSARL